jgi:hypothetical protein
MSILKVVKRIALQPELSIKDYSKSANRINAVGESLEQYIKDLFAGNDLDDNLQTRIENYNKYFSYLGNQNNPPDFILKAGDAVEIKKIQSKKSALALNSSYPKSMLKTSDPMITKKCKECEDWVQKDLLYIIGHLEKNKLKYLWMVYGDCFAAESSVYEKIKKIISTGVNSINGVEFTHTNELAKIKKVDPLGITDLRVRGMWHIQNPLKIFEYLNCIDSDAEFQLIVIMKTDKYDSQPEEDKQSIKAVKNKNFNIKNINILDPNNPAKFIKAKLISFKVNHENS